MTMGAKRYDLLGKRFGKFLVVANLPPEKVVYSGKIRNKYYVLVDCDCGAKGLKYQKHFMQRGKVTNCGCDKLSITKEYHLEYSSWSGMKNRCFNVNSPSYEFYGKEGVGVSEDWLYSFNIFLEDMGRCPDGYSLDRIDVTGDYCKENCRWADDTTQSYNTKMQRNNTSGRTGVRERITAKGIKWIVEIKQKYVGIYSTFEEACEVREALEIEIYGYSKTNQATRNFIDDL